VIEEHRTSLFRRDAGATLIGRRLIAVIAAGAFVASVVVYLYSFKGLTLDAMGYWVFALHGGIFLFFVPMCVIEHSSLTKQTFFWKEFNKGKPGWVYFFINFLGLIALVHFVLFLVLSHAASPQIMNGQYVLNGHGQIRKILTESEYLSLKGYELRIFATGWIFFYFALAAYWWFPRWKENSISGGNLIGDQSE
jgi:hypothetical protein